MDVEPSKGDASTLADTFHSTLVRKNHDVSQTEILIADSPRVISAGVGGMMASYEERYLGRSAHHMHCLIHLHKLELRHVIQALLGISSAPDAMKGVIGSKVKELAEGTSSLKLLKKFKPIKDPNYSKIPEGTVKSFHECTNSCICFMKHFSQESSQMI